MRNHDVAARKCPKCHRVFSKVEHLRRHERSHTGERPFKCKACGRSYARSDVLNRHMRHHHPAAQEGDAVEAAAGWISMTDQPQERTSPPLHAGSHEGGTSNRRLSSGEQPPPECLTPQGLVIPETENQNWNPTTIDGMSGLDLQYDQGLHGFLHDVHAPGLTSDLHRSQSTAMPSSRRALNPFEPHMDSSLGLAPPHRTVDSGMDLGSTFLEGLLLTPPGSGENQFGSPQKNSISNEQFEQVRRLWPTRRRRPTLSPSPICWDDVLLHPEDNIFSSTSLKALGSLEPSASALSSTLSPWALTEACRDRLTQTMLRYVSPNGQTDDPRGGSPPCSGPWNSELPPIDMLDICLDLYFGKFQVHLPFVHPGTFKPCDTPSILLFPMCLIGMMLLDRSASRKLIDDYLLGAIRHCRAEITSQGIRHCPAPDLFTVLGSACLVLFIAASTAEIAFEEQRQALYEEALCLARERGLFGSCSYNSGLIQIVGDDAITWNAWARMQSAQRLKACLILADAYSAHMLGTPPALLPGHIQMPLLCHDELFNAHTPHKWKKVLGNEDPWRMTSFMTPDIQNAPSRLHGLGLQTDLAVIWLDILRSHHERERRVGLFPGSLASSHESPPSVGTDTIGDYHLGSRLSSVFDTYGAELKAVNSNSLILWHFLCLQLTTDMGLIEDAAGRSGPEAAKVAVEGLRLWAPSTGARRACLHAAQMFMLVSHHRQSDGVMLHSEMAIFNAALVLGFYVFTAPDFTSSGRPLYDLLEEVDWTQVGTLGIDAQWSSGNVITPVSAAGAFIRDGGPICFSGAEYCNPYGAARRSFMNVACQLEEVGKWNVEEYCRVLRIISDTLFTPEDQHAES